MIRDNGSTANSRTVAIVTGAPLQILSLYEAETFYGLVDYEFYGTQAAIRIARRVGLTPRNYFEFEYPMARYRRLHAIRSLFQQIENASTRNVLFLVVGTPGLIAQSAVKRLSPENVVVLEDGAATLEMSGSKRKKRSIRTAVRSGMRNIIVRIFGLTDQPFTATAVFTPLDIKSHPNGPVCAHAFPRLQQKSISKSIDYNTAWVCGTNGLGASEINRRAIIAARRYFSGNLYFKPHPTGPLELEYADLVNGFLDRDMPIEILAANTSELPGHVFFIGSSIALTFPKIASEDINLMDLIDEL